jgi:hypothetical protein
MPARISAVSGGKDSGHPNAIGDDVDTDDKRAPSAEWRLEESGDELEERIEHLDEQMDDLKSKAARHRRHAGQEDVPASDAGLAKDEDYEG